jgi:hypothetical protein
MQSNGYEILRDSASPLFQCAAVVARAHHEKFDGSGYPLALAGEAIPLHGRIVAVADVFDALTSETTLQKGVGPRRCPEVSCRRCWQPFRSGLCRRVCCRLGRSAGHPIPVQRCPDPH